MNPLHDHPGPTLRPVIPASVASQPHPPVCPHDTPSPSVTLHPSGADGPPIPDPPCPESKPPEVQATSLRAMPKSERPRERLIQNGADTLQTAELLGLLLRTGLPGANAVAIGESIHRHFGSLATLSRASHGELAVLRGVGPGKAAILLAALELGRRVSREAINSAPVLDTPARIAALLADTAAGWKAERMVVLLLNTRCRLIRMETVTEGLIDQVLVHPREIFRPAIASGAHSIVMVHNHPSGDPSPSEADIRVTREILRAGVLLRIEVLDHVILGRPSDRWAKGYSSLRELGHLRPA